MTFALLQHLLSYSSVVLIDAGAQIVVIPENPNKFKQVILCPGVLLHFNKSPLHSTRKSPNINREQIGMPYFNHLNYCLLNCPKISHNQMGVMTQWVIN